MLSRVLAKKFLSWDEMKYSFKQGISLADGWNEDDQTPEGSGKSSIPNAICWNFFGKLPKDVNIDEVIKIGESSCEVVTEFSDGMSIFRSRKPNDLYMVKDGKIIKGKDARETQQLIQDYLGLSFESFCQSSYFPQNYEKKYLLLNQEDKGKILSDIQDINIFDKARKEVQELIKLELDKHSKVKNKIVLNQNSLHGVESQKQLINSFINDKIKRHELFILDLARKKEVVLNSITQDEVKKQQLINQLQKIDINSETSKQLEITNSKQQIQTSLAEVSYKRSQLSNIKTSYSLKEQEGKRLASKYSLLTTKIMTIDQYIANPTKNCPTCNTLLENTDVSHAQKERLEITQDLESIMLQLENISTFLDSNKPESDSELILKDSELKQSIAAIDKSLSEIDVKIKEFNILSNSVPYVDESINKSKTLLDEYTKSIELQKTPDLSDEYGKLSVLNVQSANISQELEELTKLESQIREYHGRLEELKDGFKEIKSYVFNTALNELSHRANEFLSVLFQVPARLESINEDMKIQSKIYLDETERSIGLLSGGQFRRFCLAIDLALADMVTSRKTSKVGVLIMDEYFQNLSEVSMEKCLNLLKLRKCPVLLIEHNTIFKNIVDDVFFVRLEGGTSRESRQ